MLLLPPTFDTLPKPDVPPEQTTGLVYGIVGHLGTPGLYLALLLAFGLNAWNAIVQLLVASAVCVPFTLWCETQNPVLQLPPLTWMDCIGGLSVVFYKGILIGNGFIVFGWWLLTRHVQLHDHLSNSWSLVLLATVLTDLAYYWIHRCLSHGRGRNPIVQYYRRNHLAHHSVHELDFMRGNQSSLVDTAIGQFQPSLILLSWLLGMDLGATLAAYGFILALQSTDHTNVTFNIGWLRYIFMDNHAHKLHHCKKGHLVNHAAAFSFFDRLWGTYYEDWSMSSNYLHHNGIALPIVLCKI
eukprot:Nitzschia sp. Nitz4//scaffold67_size101165//42463//43356//NITZ4_004525-RA/size101165-processed-gene-0.58-mRNA-1//-1//CDS//3329556462//5426//frame0